MLLALSNLNEALSPTEQAALNKAGKQLDANPKAWDIIEIGLMKVVGANDSLHQQYQAAINIGLKWERDFQGKGSFLGGSIFELSQYQLLMQESTQDSTPRTVQQLQENIHLIVAVMPSRDAAKIVWEDFNTELLRLFCYQHKVFWAYAQSRYLKQQLKKDFRVINQLVGNIYSQNLKQLRKTVVDAQNILPEYTTKLNYLDAQIRTIEINAINYSRRIGTIGDRLNQI